jgi:hypothetical protein
MVYGAAKAATDRGLLGRDIYFPAETMLFKVVDLSLRGKTHAIRKIVFDVNAH